MNKIAVVTDSNSGITQEMAKEMGISVIPMPFYINDEPYLEGISLNHEGFYEKLASGADVKTSQPTPETVMALWDELLNENDEIVHIPMSSGLSGSYQTANMLAEDYDGRVHVANNQRISVTMRQSAVDALELAKNGRTGAEIKQILEDDRFNSSIYIMLDTLYYLKKGGRITPAAAALGTLLKLKPVLQIQGEKLDAFAKARTVAQAKSIMINAIKHDLETRFGGATPENCSIQIAYTHNEADAIAFKDEVEEAFPGIKAKFVDPLSLSVACHIGPGALAVACTKNLKY